MLPRPLHTRLRRTSAGLAAATLALGLLAACSSDDDPGDESPAAETSASGSASSSAEATGEGTDAEEAAAPEPVLVGDQPLIHPCRLVDLDAVEKAFGPMPKQGSIEQVYPATSVTGAAWKRASRFDGKLETVCDYGWGVGDGHFLRVRVDHYESEERAQAEWGAIAYLGSGQNSRELEEMDLLPEFEFIVELAKENEAGSGGKTVAGAKHLLYVPGRQQWVTWRDHTLVTLSWARPFDVFNDEPLTPEQYRFQAPRMKALARAARRADVTDQTPLPVQLDNGDDFEGTPYLEPCDLLDDEVVESLVEWTPTPAVDSYTTQRDVRRRVRQGGDSPFHRSPGASCERTADGPPGDVSSRTATIEVRYAADARTTQKLIGEWAVNDFFDEEHEKKYGLGNLERFGMATARASDADWLYIIDTDEVSSTKVVEAYAAVGPYVVHVDADLGLAGDNIRQVDAEAYVAAVNLVAARIRELTDDCSGDCPAT